MRLLILRLVLLGVLLLTGGFTNQPAPVQDEQAQTAWREDLHFMADRMEAIHPNLFWRVSEADFRQMVSTLDAEIPHLTDEQIILGLTRIVSIADAHSHLTLYQPAVGFEVYPLQVYFFPNGMFVIDAEDEALIGTEVVSINDHSIEEVYNRVAPLVTHDNRYGMVNLAPSFIISPQVLRGLGIIDDISEPNFALQAGDGSLTLYNPAPTQADESWWSEWFMTNLPQRAAPLYLTQHLDQYFWFTLLEESRTLYIQYNWMDSQNPDGKSIYTFTRELGAFIDGNEFERVVLDLRHNSGGNNTTYRSLLRLLTENERINQPDTLFVLIGRRTFSAAANLVIDLEQGSEAVFVGEPMGDMPNMYADPSSFTLPNSRIVVAISRIFWNKSPDDPRETVEPHIPVTLSSEDYFSGHDPALEAVLSLPD